MQLEKDVEALLISGFTIVRLICIIVFGVLWIKTKNNSFFWFLVQMALLSLSFYFFIRLCKSPIKIEPTMVSEENSLLIGQIGILWALSMLSMIIGVIALIKRKIILR